LNLTVAPAVQGRGHALTLLERVRAHCRSACAGSLWLEVRIGNRRARAVYERWGMRAVGLRRGYYPAAGGRREDALVMSLQIGGDDGAQ
jgi:ribosomal-protein-alanine N-acetyltransferase